MNESDFKDEFAAILDARAGRSALEAAVGVEDAELLAALDAVDLAWEAQLSAPPLEDDPTAIMLGLVLDPEISFASAAALAARKNAGLSVSQLAERLKARGWDVESQDVFAWERGSRNVVPALARAIAGEVGLAADALVREAGSDPSRERLRSIFKLPEFQELARRWAQLQKSSFSGALAALEARAVAAVHRGGAPEPEIVLRSLEALVEALEGKGDPPTP